MRSILNIKCRACDVLKKISTGNIHPGKSETSVILDINSKIALGNVHRSSLKKILSNFVNHFFNQN